VRDEEELRSLLQTLGSAALGVGLGVAILAAGFYVSNVALGDSTSAAAPTPVVPNTAATNAASASAAPMAPPTVAPTPTPTATPTPTPTKDPLTVAPYSSGGLRYAAVTLSSTPYTYTSPVAGTVSIAIYQFIGGEVRVGSNDPTVPSFPYVTVTSNDRRIRIRPSSTDSGVVLTAEDGQKVAAGDPLFTIASLSPSSWRTFYDRNVTAQVIVSVSTLAGAEVDPLTVFQR
jgi:biotin carboxyl carrier protein